MATSCTFKDLGFMRVFHNNSHCRGTMKFSLPSNIHQCAFRCKDIEVSRCDPLLRFQASNQKLGLKTDIWRALLEIHDRTVINLLSIQNMFRSLS